MFGRPQEDIAAQQGRRRRWPIAIGALLSALWCMAGAQAQATYSGPGATEQQVEAAYLYKFTGYIEWPSSVLPGPTDPIVIGVVGGNDVADNLERIADRLAGKSRPVVVRALRPEDLPTGIQILFIGHLKKDETARLLARAKGLPILTVTAADDASDRDGMIKFVVVEGNLRFIVSLEPAMQANLKISSLLLSAAYKVIPGAAP